MICILFNLYKLLFICILQSSMKYQNDQLTSIDWCFVVHINGLGTSLLLKKLKLYFNYLSEGILGLGWINLEVPIYKRPGSLHINTHIVWGQQKSFYSSMI